MKNRKVAYNLAKILLSLEKESEAKRKTAVAYLVQELKYKRVALLQNVLGELVWLSREREVVLATAREDLSENVIWKMKKTLKEVLGEDKQIKIKTDKDIVGGFVAKSRDFLIDGSVKGMLKRAKNLS